MPSKTITEVHEGAPLSFREYEVLMLITTGDSDKQIAEILGLGVRTVQTHTRRLYRKLGVKNRTDAAIFLLLHGVPVSMKRNAKVVRHLSLHGKDWVQK